ncbi:MAG: hypothetical protein ACAH11_09760 [Sphingomonas sp.]
MTAGLIRQLSAGAALCIAALFATPAAAQTGVVEQQFKRADYAYDQHGYVRMGWEKQSILRNGAEQSFTITLTGGSEYSLIGVCDADCENLDIYVTDDKGVEVTKDAEDDDYPVVYIKRGGTMNVRVVMKGCRDSPCEFGIRAYRM